MHKEISVKNLTKEFKDTTGFVNRLFVNIDLNIDQNKITAVLAPKGAGKSSLLKIIAGLDDQYTGEINPANFRTLYIPSGSFTFPWLNVKENILFGIDTPDLKLFKEAVETVGLEGYEDHYPKPISSGFLFRVALGRAIVHKPELLILDEPFVSMKDEIKFDVLQLTRKIATKYGLTVLYASSSLSNCVYLSDKIYLMKKSPGRIITEIEINLGIERPKSILNSEKTISLRNKLQSFINSENVLSESEFTF